jgi:hypothetical protein
MFIIWQSFTLSQWKDKRNNGEGRNHKEQKRKSYALDLTAVILSHKIKFQLGLLYKMSKGGKKFLNSVQYNDTEIIYKSFLNPAGDFKLVTTKLIF